MFLAETLSNPDREDFDRSNQSKLEITKIDANRWCSV